MIDRLNDLGAAWSGSLFLASWQGGLAIAAAWVLVRGHRGLPPRVACWAWRLADVKLIVALLWTAPLLLPLLPPAPHPAPIAETLAPDLDIPPIPAVGTGPFAEPAGGLVEAPVYPRPGPASAAMLCWLAGVVGAAGLAGKGWLAAARVRRACPPIDRPDLREAAVELAGALGLRDIPELRAGPEVVRPMLVGALRPAILLPVAMLEASRSIDSLRPVLAHELAHVRRRDLWWSGLTGAVRALFWFHPLVWLAHREALLARETACDALAIRAAGVRLSEYGRILLEIAAGGPERPSRWAATLGMAGPAGSLGRRLMAMKTIQQPSRSRLLSWAFALLAVGAAGIVPWRIVPRAVIAQEPTPPAKPAAPDRKVGQDPAEESKARLKVAGARLRTARLGLKAREADLEKAEADARAAAARLEYRRKQRDRFDQLVQRGAIEHGLLDEEEDRLRVAEAGDRVARLGIAVARANREAAEAAIREARADYDIARAGARLTPEVEAELGLEAAQAELARADPRLKLAEVDLLEAAAARQNRRRQLDRMSELAKTGAVEQRLVDEETERFRVAQAHERATEARLAAARAEVERAEAAVREAEARGDLARARSQTDGGPEAAADPKLLKEARARLHQARLDRARAEREAARAEVDRAEADVETARASLAYRTRQLERVKQLAAQGAIEQRLVDEEDHRLAEARHAAGSAEAALKSARARLEAAEARVKAVEAEARGTDRPAVIPPPRAPR